jgi:hypothetical protein
MLTSPVVHPRTLPPACPLLQAIRRRLQAKESALKTLTKNYLAFANAVESSSVEECEPLYQRLLLEIAQFEFQTGKASALVDTNLRQVEEYDSMQQRVEAEMCADASHAQRLALSLSPLICPSRRPSLHPRSSALGG